jgi:malonyl-CoA/methylmalonyl-CoA synthetase
VHDAVNGWIDAAELDRRSAAVAGRLHAAGVERGDRVLISGEPSVDFVVAHCGALRAGFVVVPVNSAYSARELALIVEDAGPAAAILEPAELRRAASALDPNVVAVDVDVGLPEGPLPPLDDLRPDDPALLPYTSGTTGTPKGALLTHGNLLASAAGLGLAWRWDERDRLILCLPLFHMHGLGVGVHGALLAGCGLILQRRFDAEAVLAACSTASLFFGVPTMYARLADAEGAERLGALRLCVSGSAPLSPELHRRIGERGRQTVLERYGMTETVMLVSNPYERGRRRAGTVGFPLPGVEVRLDEATSEIEVRGPNVFGGYWNRPELAAATFTPDGWFRTGDIGAFDREGYLTIVGRSKELIITGGFNVYPREIEDVLRAHPDVEDAAVVGVPSDEWGEVVTAYVEAGPDFDEAAVRDWLADQLAGYKRPRTIHRVEALPRNRLGKVLRHELSPASVEVRPRRKEEP